MADININSIKTMNEDKLQDEFMHWFRVYRNKGALKGKEREYFKALGTEVDNRDTAKNPKVLDK